MYQVPHPTQQQTILSAKYIMWPFNDMVHELYFSDTVHQQHQLSSLITIITVRPLHPNQLPAK